MDLSTPYLGLRLSSPLIVGASPIADEIHVARQAQDSGAGAIVLRSLFEEQIYLDQWRKTNSGFAPRQDILPALSEYQLSPDRYLKQIDSLKTALAIPIIASLNGSAPGDWIDYAARFEAAGADAIELNLYHVSSDPNDSALEVEAELLEAVHLLKSAVRIPVAVKLQPYHTALAHFTHELERVGVAGVVLFNRLYQSDLPVDGSRPSLQPRLSDPGELLLRLRWLALLSPQLKCSLGLTGGVETGEHALKAVLAGAHGIQVVSALLRNGPRFLAVLLEAIRHWMAEWDFSGLDHVRGQLSQPGPDAALRERADYQRLLQSWRV